MLVGCLSLNKPSLHLTALPVYLQPVRLTLCLCGLPARNCVLHRGGADHYDDRATLFNIRGVSPAPLGPLSRTCAAGLLHRRQERAPGAWGYSVLLGCVTARWRGVWSTCRSSPCVWAVNGVPCQAIDSSTIARWRSRKASPVLGKGYCQRAQRAVRANIVAALN